MLGDVVNAEEAVHLGLAVERVPDGRLIERATALAERLAGKDRTALLANRQLLDHGASASLDRALDDEVEANVRLLGGGDAFRAAARRFSRPVQDASGGAP